MRYSLSRTLALRFAAAVLAAGVLALSAFGDPGRKADVVKPHAKIQFDASAVEVITKKPRAFRAIEMVDPQTGKRIAPTQMMTTPGGKRVTAKVYFAELNEFEKKLARMGHSIRDKGETVVLSRHRVNAAEMEKKAKLIARHHLPFNVKTMRKPPRHADLPGRFKAQAQADLVRVNALQKHLAGGAAKGAAKGVKKSPVNPGGAGASAPTNPAGGTVKQWQHELGNRKVIGAILSAQLTTKGDKEGVSVQGSVEANAYLANKQLSLLRATGSAGASKSGPGKATITVTVAGQTVYNKDFSVQSGEHKADKLSKTFDQGVSFRFSLGPIPMSAKVGVSGSLGLSYFVGVQPLSVQAQFIPFAHVKAYAQCGVDAKVVKVGVRAKLQVIDFEMTVGGELVVQATPGSGLSLKEHAYISNNLQMLEGELALYADIGFSFLKKRFEHTFWKYKGFKTNGYLLNVSRTTPILN
jgi:hypothetical protein